MFYLELNTPYLVHLLTPRTYDNYEEFGIPLSRETGRADVLARTVLNSQ